MEVCEDVRRVGNRVAEVRFEYFCWDYVSRNGVSVMERNTASQVQSNWTLTRLVLVCKVGKVHTTSQALRLRHEQIQFPSKGWVGGFQV